MAGVVHLTKISHKLARPERGIKPDHWERTA
jgi:hypothetical protein